MNRLTNTANSCNICCKEEEQVSCIYKKAFNETCSTAKVYEKLKEYEDLEEQGLLIKLPCKVGTTVYKIYNTRGCGNCVNLESSCGGLSCPSPKIIKTKFSFKDLGKLQDAFLTREEAEKALEKTNEL